jgi:hypothetical protein
MTSETNGFEPVLGESSHGIPEKYANVCNPDPFCDWNNIEKVFCKISDVINAYDP